MLFSIYFAFKNPLHITQQEVKNFWKSLVITYTTLQKVTSCLTISVVVRDQNVADMPDRHLSVVPKLGLYTLDVVTDWINGVSLLTSHNSTNGTNLDLNNLIISDSSHVFNATIHEHDCLSPDVCSQDNDIHLWWGSLTIALSWVPATIGMFITVAGGDLTPSKILLMPIRFILWPLLVPLLM